MSINKNYAVFGLGRYGISVAKELIKNGAEVLAVDSCEAVVNSAIADIPVCKCADITSPEIMKSLGIENFDVVIIAMASSLESSVMATVLCKEAGVETVIAKCANEMHRKILTKVGADKVIFPESESGIRLAKNLLSSGFVDLMELNNKVSMVELDIKEDWIGKTLLDLNLRKKHSINVVAIRQGNNIEVEIDPQKPLKCDMKLIVIANTAKLARLK